MMKHLFHCFFYLFIYFNLIFHIHSQRKTSPNTVEPSTWGELQCLWRQGLSSNARHVRKLKISSLRTFLVMLQTRLLWSLSIPLGFFIRFSFRSCLFPSGRISLTFTGASHPVAASFIIITNATSYLVPGDSFLVSNSPRTSSQQTSKSSATSTTLSLQHQRLVSGG
jgi:hypothetical protein